MGVIVRARVGGVSTHLPSAAHQAWLGMKNLELFEKSRRRACLTADRGGGWGAGGQPPP